MRIPKYKAYVKELNSIHDVVAISFNLERVGIMDKGTDYEECWYDFDEVELMEYTGLQDKNGVEIFEGDIVKGTLYLIVPFTNETISISWQGGHEGWGTHWNSNESEVIGNIYQNKELIE